MTGEARNRCARYAGAKSQTDHCARDSRLVLQERFEIPIPHVHYLYVLIGLVGIPPSYSDYLIVSCCDYNHKHKQSFDGYILTKRLRQNRDISRVSSEFPEVFSHLPHLEHNRLISMIFY